MPASDRHHNTAPASRQAMASVRNLGPPVPGPKGPRRLFVVLPQPNPSSPHSRLPQTPGIHLLYVGIAPTSPPEDGGRPSSQHLGKRIQYHLRGNAEGSSLRLSLGCLLAPTLGLQLRRVGSGTRFTFAAGEPTLSAWLETNARVAWLECEQPWLLESELIHTLSLPLNLGQNDAHPFFPKLTALRAEARAKARSLPVIQG